MLGSSNVRHGVHAPFCLCETSFAPTVSAIDGTFMRRAGPKRVRRSDPRGGLDPPEHASHRHFVTVISPFWPEWIVQTYLIVPAFVGVYSNV